MKKNSITKLLVAAILVLFLTFTTTDLLSQNWSACGTGSNNVVRALTTFSGQLIAAGDFTTIGGIGANRIASWNGTSWSAMGLGTNGRVSAL
ncbi:MAG TPA: hypothetical protein DCX92_02710, partial [Bacteroidetes bacterium]|nr:hypothetical protein [Bacteroidota bacterium]